MTLKVLCVLLHFYMVGIFCFPLDHDQEKYKKPTQPYSFSYGVKDGYQGTDFERSEASDGNAVVGTYSVQLPDGRKQTVKYEADHNKGFVADVSYVGEAQYPPPSKVPPFVVRHHPEQHIENIDNSLPVPRPVPIHSSQLETEDDSFDLHRRPRPLPQPVNLHNIPHFKHNAKSQQPSFPDLDTEDRGTHVPPFSPHLLNIGDAVTNSKRVQGANDVPHSVNFDPVEPFLNREIIPEIPFNQRQYGINPFATQFRIPNTPVYPPHETFEPNLGFEVNHEALLAGRPGPDISGEFSTKQKQVIINENRFPKWGAFSLAGRYNLPSFKSSTEKNEKDFEKNKALNLHRVMLQTLRGSEIDNEFGKRKFFDRKPSDVGSPADNLFIPKYIQSEILPGQQNFYQLLKTPYDPEVLNRLQLSFYQNRNLLEPTQIHPKHRRFMTDFLDESSPKSNIHTTGGLSSFGLHSSEVGGENHFELGNQPSPSPIYIPNETQPSLMQPKPQFRLIKRFADNKTSSNTREIKSPHEEKSKEKLTT